MRILKVIRITKALLMGNTLSLSILLVQILYSYFDFARTKLELEKLCPGYS